jgi:predicted RNase H-like nuclease (RuvC/YqgF family)
MAKKWYQSVRVRATFILGASSIIVAGMYILHARSELKQKNENYEKEIKIKNTLIVEKDSEIQRLETQLIPFKTIAIEKFTGTEQEALLKLANKLQELEKHIDPLKKPLASATAKIEIIIKTDKHINARYGAGGYLAFCKNGQFLLMTIAQYADTYPHAEGEVLYKLDLQMDAENSAVGKPIEILQTSDLIQIMFHPHPIPENSQVVKGKASVVINGNERFEFEILPQQMQGKNIFIRDVKINF